MAGDSPTLQRIRRFLLLLVAAGTAAMAIDLLLIGHFEDGNQLIPVTLAGVALVAFAWVAFAPSMISLRVTQFVMLCFVGAGIIGITLHFKANAEFQREIEPAISTRDLFWKVMEATAPPALSPGLMVQLGVLGLVYTYKHPALREDAPDGP
jgi:hypothetical protein